MKNKWIFLIFLLGLLTNSCLKRQFVDSRADLVTISDTILNDSIIIYGHVYRLDWTENYNYQDKEFEIWIDKTEIKTYSDTAGFYSLKLQPGTISIRCQEVWNDWDKLIAKIDNLDITKNKIVNIDFYIGYTIE